MWALCSVRLSAGAEVWSRLRMLSGLQGEVSQVHSRCREIAFFMPVWRRCLAAFHKGSLFPYAISYSERPTSYKLETSLRGWPRCLTWCWAYHILFTKPTWEMTVKAQVSESPEGCCCCSPPESFFLAPPVALSVSCKSHASHVGEAGASDLVSVQVVMHLTVGKSCYSITRGMKIQPLL